MKKMLIAEHLHAALDSIIHFAERPDIAVYMGARNDDLMRLHFEHNANLIVTQPELPGMSCESFVNVIRRSETLRNVSILLLISETASQRERAMRAGANCILPLSAGAEDMSKRVHGLLNIAPRSSYRVLMNMAVESKKNNRPFMCNMENISSNGMLVRTAEALSRGDQIRCSFYLPDGTHITTEGAVTRAVPGAGGQDAQRYGVHFRRISQENAAAVASFVEKEWRRRRSAAEEGRSRIA